MVVSNVKHKEFGEKAAAVRICPPLFPHGFNWD
jgi:hypothetical protein